MSRDETNATPVITAGSISQHLLLLGLIQMPTACPETILSFLPKFSVQ